MDFKRLSMPAAVIAAAVSIGLTGCSQKTSSTVENDEKTAFATDSVNFTDTLALSDVNTAVCNIGISYPVEGNRQLIDSINHWIARRFSNDPIAQYNDVAAMPDYTGITNIDSLAYVVGNDLLTEAKNAYGFEDVHGVSSNYEVYWNITDICRTDRYITYSALLYAYLGGAHGGANYQPAVFATADGRQFGWNMFTPDSYKQLSQLIKAALMKDFFKVSTDSELQNCLLVDSENLPLPATQPYFMPDGVHFTYQQYEIAPYAAGMPEAVIPFSEAVKYMTPAAKALVD